MYKTIQPSTPKNNLLSDSELINRYIKGDEASIGVLIDRHKERVFAYLMKHARNRALAEDIFQEAFFKAIRSLKEGNYREEYKFLSWMIRIARNLLIDYFRKYGKIRMISCVKNREGKAQDIFNVINVEDRISNRHIEKRQAHRQIRHLIKQLPIEQREILVMREYFDMSFNEICDMMDMNLNTALGRMRYAVMTLRKLAQAENIQR